MHCIRVCLCVLCSVSFFVFNVKQSEAEFSIPATYNTCKHCIVVSCELIWRVLYRNKVVKKSGIISLVLSKCTCWFLHHVLILFGFAFVFNSLLLITCASLIFLHPTANENYTKHDLVAGRTLIHSGCTNFEAIDEESIQISIHSYWNIAQPCLM